MQVILLPESTTVDLQPGHEPRDLSAIYLPYADRENFLEYFPNIRVPGEPGAI